MGFLGGGVMYPLRALSSRPPRLFLFSFFSCTAERKEGMLIFVSGYEPTRGALNDV